MVYLVKCDRNFEDHTGSDVVEYRIVETSNTKEAEKVLRVQFNSHTTYTWHALIQA